MKNTLKRAARFLDTPMKIVGAVIALISLVLGIIELKNMATSWFEKKERALQLANAALLQSEGHNYQAAWNMIEEAVSLDDGHASIRDTLAMRWLRALSFTEVPVSFRYSEVVDKLVPVLSRRVEEVDRASASSIMAHLGWANELKSWDGTGGLDIRGYYRRSLDLDSANVFAHAMLGYSVCRNDSLSYGMDEFAKAVRSGAEREFVRKLEFSALRRSSDTLYRSAFLAVLSDMRKNKETLSPAKRSSIAGDLYYFCNNEKALGTMLRSLPPADHLQMVNWLVEGTDKNKAVYIQVIRARLNELIGDTEAALLLYRSVNSDLELMNSFFAEAITDGIKRLGK